MLKKILGDSEGLEIKKKCRNKKQYKTNTEAKLELFLKRSKNIHYDQFEEKFLYYCVRKSAPRLSQTKKKMLKKILGD